MHNVKVGDTIIVWAGEYETDFHAVQVLGISEEKKQVLTTYGSYSFNRLDDREQLQALINRLQGALNKATR